MAKFPKGTSGNPAGRKRRVRNDGLTNVLTGIGTTRDRRTYASYLTRAVGDLEAREMWRANAMAARIIEIIPREVYREGYEIKIAGDPELSGEVSKELKKLSADQKLRRAGEYERAYGGAAIFPEVNDGQGDLAMPLNENRILSFGKLHVYEPRELTPETYDEDGVPEVWVLTPLGRRSGSYMTRIHASRLILWPGIRVTNDAVTGTREGWGDSRLTRVFESLRDYDQAHAGAAAVTTDFAKGVHKIAGLANLLAANEEEVVRKRIEILDMMSSVLRSMVIDSQDEYTRQQTPVSGLDGLLRALAERFAAAADLPLTVLFGTSPAGMNATGKSDVQLMNDRTSAAQDIEHPRVHQLVRLMMLARLGPTSGREPKDWCVEWKSLWQPTDEERETARKSRAETDAIYLDRGVLFPKEVMKSRFTGDGFSYETTVDLAEREELERVSAEAAAAYQAEVEAKKAVALGGKPAGAAGDGTEPGADPADEAAAEDATAEG